MERAFFDSWDDESDPEIPASSQPIVTEMNQNSNSSSYSRHVPPHLLNAEDSRIPLNYHANSRQGVPDSREDDPLQRRLNDNRGKSRGSSQFQFRGSSRGRRSRGTGRALNNTRQSSRGGSHGVPNPNPPGYSRSLNQPHQPTKGPITEFNHSSHLEKGRSNDMPSPPVHQPTPPKQQQHVHIPPSPLTPNQTTQPLTMLPPPQYQPMRQTVGNQMQIPVMSTPAYMNTSVLMRGDPSNMYPVTFISPQPVQNNPPQGLTRMPPQPNSAPKRSIPATQLVSSSTAPPIHTQLPLQQQPPPPRPAPPQPHYQIARRPQVNNQRQPPLQQSAPQQGHIPFQSEAAATPNSFQTQASSQPTQRRNKSPNRTQTKTAKTVREPSPQPSKDEPAEPPSQPFRILRRKKPVQTEAPVSKKAGKREGLSYEERKKRYEEMKQSLIQKEERRKREEERALQRESMRESRRQVVMSAPPAGPPQLPVNRSSDLNPFAKEFVPGNW